MRIIVDMSGGVCQYVCCDDPTANILIVDWDNISDGNFCDLTNFQDSGKRTEVDIFAKALEEPWCTSIAVLNRKDMDAGSSL